MTLAQLAIALAVVFAVNLLPAFGPPTWAVLVFFSLDFDLPAVPLVLGGALAAASGRFLLAHGARRLRPRLSAARRESVDRAQAALSADRRRTAAGLSLFALSPVPSGQLFVGAGLMTVPLLPLTAAFFAGRLVSYSIYVSVATIAEKNLGDLALNALTSPLGLALQLLMLVALALLLGGLKPAERLGESSRRRVRGLAGPGSRR
jgi:membrane protein YqaA with SNARE-associated domain